MVSSRVRCPSTGSSPRWWWRRRPPPCGWRRRSACDISVCEFSARALYSALEDGVRVAAARRCCRPRRSGLRSGSTRKQVGITFFFTCVIIDNWINYSGGGQPGRWGRWWKAMFYSVIIKTWKGLLMFLDVKTKTVQKISSAIKKEESLFWTTVMTEIQFCKKKNF